jgi:structural maintenance of chromosome 2
MSTDFPSALCFFDNGFRQFGQSGGEFDFAKRDMSRLKERAAELEDSQRGMKKKINPKVLNMIEK